MINQKNIDVKAIQNLYGIVIVIDDRCRALYYTVNNVTVADLVWEKHACRAMRG